jgi:hypothetical protein
MGQLQHHSGLALADLVFCGRMGTLGHSQLRVQGNHLSSTLSWSDSAFHCELRLSLVPSEQSVTCDGPPTGGMLI